MSSLIIDTLKTILVAYLATGLLQVLFWPITRKIFANLADEGWALGRFLGVVGTSLVVWELSYLGLPLNTKLGIITCLLLVLLINIFLIKKESGRWLLPKKETLKLIFLEEYLFFVGFWGISLVRSYLPNLDSLEKFMDYGFIVRYLQSPTLPAMDMWQAGSYINYYSFGHFWASVLIRIMSVPSAVGYNLVLGFIAGMSLMLSFLACFSLSGALQKRGSMVGSFLGALVVTFGGNTHTLWYLLKNRSLNDYWYADATRFIHNTIHEFPSYSLVVSDLHGHLFDLPVVLAFILVLTLSQKRERNWNSVILGGLMGVMMMTNTWDVPIYGLLLGVWYLISFLVNPEKIGELLISSLIILLVMVSVSLPWWLKFVPISSGIALVTMRSPLWQLGALWGLAVIINLATWFLSKGSEKKLLLRSLIITSVILVVIPELVFAKDIYPDHPRANTMFKLTYQSFIMVGLMFGVMVSEIVKMIREKKTLLTLGGLVVSIVVFGSVMVYPTLAFPSFYENFKTFYGLNGEEWLKNKHPIKYEAIQFLKERANGKNMVEAVGDSYSELNAVSVFSGIPTIQGWRVHEWLWRGGYETVAIREQEVRQIYEGDDAELTKQIINKYNVGWILVSLDEEEMYLINHPKINSLGEVAWENGENYIVKIN